MKREEVAITPFGPVLLEHDLVTAESFTPPNLIASNRTPMGEADGEFTFFSVGVENANIDVSSQIGSRRPAKLRGLHFRELLLWLSKSLLSVSQSRVGQQVALPATDGWQAVNP